MGRKNYDYAAKMFQQCARLVPDNVHYRQVARGAASKMYGDNKSGASSMKKMKIGGFRSKAKKAKGKENYSEASASLEEALLLNPWDVQCNVDLSEIAQAAEWMEVAQFAMTCARNADPDNQDLNVALADVLADRHQFTEAAKVYEHLATLDPENGHYRTMVSRMYTKHTTESAKFEEAGKATDLRADGTMESHEIEKRLKTGKGNGPADGPGMDTRADLERQTRKNPESVESWQKLGAYLRTQKDFSAAFEAFAAAEKLVPEDPAIREQKEDVELEVRRLKLADARESGDADAIKEAATTLIKREMQVFETRIQRYPQDLNLKFELGSRFLKTNNAKLVPKAIPLLQKASQSPKLKGRALVMLGQCFIKEKKPSLAKGQLERALPELHPENDEALVLDAHYLLGRIYEELKAGEKAEEHYGEVLVLDYDYKDAKDRLEALQSA